MATGKASVSKADSTKASVDEVQAKMDEVQEKGYQGTRTDPTPLEHYTVEGVIAGKPTPETDAAAAAEAAAATGAVPQVTEG